MIHGLYLCVCALNQLAKGGSVKVSIVLAAASLLTLSLTAPVFTSSPASAQTFTVSGEAVGFTVVGAVGADENAVRQAVEMAGGSVNATNTKVGTYQVTAPSTGFITAISASDAVFGAARDRTIGQAPRADKSTLEAGAEETAQPQAVAEVAGPSDLDPLDTKLWGLSAIDADTARDEQSGDHRVSVGVIDTGVDASHPDISPNFDWERSRNFAPDIVEIDGPCEDPSCVDTVGTDDGGHGTHVAGTISAAANGYGISGIAPEANLVNLKAGQDSGFFFLQPVVDALTYAADEGIDVVNMSFFVDPWLYNCEANPADTPEQQVEQRTIVAAVQRALNYAHDHDVTLVSALGNEASDLGKPGTDEISPDYPEGTAYPREIDNDSCLSMPTEGNHVLGISSIGPTGVKAYYSNYGLEQITVAAPGGDIFALDGYPKRNYAGGILSTYPLRALQENKAADGSPQPLVDDAGEVTPAGVQQGVYKECTAQGACGYFRSLHGTSMASPHAAGVATLIVSEFGTNDPRHDGELRLAPDKVERILTNTATPTACPDPALQTYPGLPASYNALCEGDTSFNGFFGHGMINAHAAVTSGPNGKQ